MDQSEELQTNIEHLVFKEVGDEIYIGGEKIKPEYRKLLKEQAYYIENSQLYEILTATILNEATRLAFESKNWDNVQYAKALKYWNTIIKNMIRVLRK